MDGRDTRIYTKRIVKGGLILEYFSLCLHLQKSITNHYPKCIHFRIMISHILDTDKFWDKATFKAFSIEYIQTLDKIWR